MFNEWRKRFGRDGQPASIAFFGGGSGSGRGGSDDDEAKKPDSDNNPGKSDDDDPFKNFDFNRFRPRRPTNQSGGNDTSTGTGSESESSKGSSGTGSSAGSGSDSPRGADTGSNGSGGRTGPGGNGRRTGGPGGSGGGNAPRNPFDFGNFGGGNFGGGRRIGGGGGNIPQLNIPRPSRRAILLIILGIIIVVLFIALPSIAGFWTDVIWFQQIKQEGVFWTRFWTQILTFLAGGVLTFIVIMLNVLIARRFGPRGPTINANPDNPLTLILGGSLRLLNLVFVLGALFISLILAGISGGAWQTILTFFNRAPWDETEKIFNRPIGYYVFELPFYSFIQGWLVGLFIVTAIAVTVVYGLNFVLSGRTFTFTPAIKTHLSLLGAIILGLFAWGYQLSNSNLVYSPRGVVPGASATDVEAQVPANNILTFVVAAAAVLLLANIFISNRRLSIGLLAGAVIIWLAGSVVIGGVFPGLYQNFSIKPNEITKEKPYISNTITMTRQAFGLDHIESSQFAGNGTVTQADLQNNPYVEQNARLWDYKVVQTVYDKKETLRNFYTFDDVDIDRYNLPLGASGTTDETQILISPREIYYPGIDKNAQNWQNLHLQFTHGYGFQASPVNRTTASGQPESLITQSFPFSTTTSLLNVQQPRIYYGTKFDDTNYAIVDTALAELDYPKFDQQSAGTNAEYKYETTANVIKLDNFFVKLAYAAKLGDFNLLISDALNANSKLLIHRNITNRAALIAPFLSYDPDPYIVAANGKIYWVQDAYTTSNRFPHSDSLSRLGGSSNINYIRNSIKVVTDAYDGTVNFYIADQASPDPLIHTYANIYPDLFKPFSQMPAELVAHLRYPEALLTAQSQVYLTYHATDPTVYYNRNDQWQIPRDPRGDSGSGGAFAPYYLVTQLPGQKQKEFALIQPFEPQTKNNLVSLLVGRMDGANYGKLVAYNFPGASNIYGPEQVYGLIQANPQFSQQVTLLGQRGSSLSYGNLLIFPIGNAILYLLPVYISGSNNPIPQLQYVTAAALVADPNNPGGTSLKTIYSTDLQTALGNLLDKGTTATAPPPNQTGGNGSTNVTPVANGSPGPAVGNTPVANGGSTVPANQPGTVSDLLRSAQTHFNNAEAARSKGDQATYQSEYQAGQNDLNRAKGLLGG